MGVVYEAFDAERRAAVALKTLSRFDSGAVSRFKQEFRALQGLSHPNLVAFDELFFENGQWFFTMELLDGLDFVSYVRDSASPNVYASTVRNAVDVCADSRVAVRTTASPSPSPASFDEGRLRLALRQLFEALAVLHAADKVHRDVKPPNVLVTHEGRVVLLDFGLVFDDAQEDRQSALLVGTPEYMAPEQAALRDVQPPADLYAVGVMLYEVLTGRMPFLGSPLQILMDKQNREPPSPASIAPNLPGDLAALCTALLRFDPVARPTATMALDALAAPSRRSLAARTPSSAPAFVGRKGELAELRASFDRSRKGSLATALVCGESGIGKSYLVRQFARDLAADHPELVVLEGRCYEREAVPYKALDGIVDALSRRLSRVSTDELDSVLPRRRAALAQLFPVMLHLPLVAEAHAALDVSTDPLELRQQAFGALRSLFQRLALTRPMLVVIDDLQWADQDGLRALAEILRPPDAPPLLLVGTVRMHVGTKVASFDALRAMLPGDTRTIDLSPLAHDDARELAAMVLRHARASHADPDAVANEAGGHPLFVEELARHVALGGSARDDVKLDDAIWSRVLQLEPGTREMAELVAVAGKPLPQEIVAAAARFAPAAFTRSAATLRATNLVRTGGASWSDAIEPYHDRVREAVLTQLPAARRAALHEALAIAFEASSSDDPETLAVHWREAGKAQLSARYAGAAGDQAARAFAFERAAQWYEQALELLPPDHASRRELRVKLGNALANAGRGPAAAVHFEAAALESPPLESLELRRRAVDQLLRSGHFDRGIEGSRAVLAAIGMRLPSSRLETLLALVFQRLRLILRGLRFRAREPAQITAQELTRIDACWSVGMALTFVDTLVGFVFMTRALLLALSAGELDRVARCVGMEIGLVGSAGGPAWKRTERLIRYARELADRSGTPQARFFALGPAGGAFFCAGRFPEAADHISRALELLDDGSLGLVHERVTMRVFLLDTLMYLGRYADLARLQREALRDAHARGDRYAEVEFTLDIPGQAWLVSDRPDLYEHHAREVMRHWPASGYHLEHFHELEGRVRLKLYLGEVAEAHALARELAARTRRSFLWRIQPIRWSCFHLPAISALAMVERGLGDKEALLRLAASNAKKLGREDMTCSEPFVKMIGAGIALRTGRRAEAISSLEAASRELEALGMKGYALTAADRAARLRADVGAADVLARTADYFRAEGVVAPDRMMQLLVPGVLETAD
jgi:serine/threonine protein kinase/tetratricopeptide (TPR) repeat protein